MAEEFVIRRAERKQARLRLAVCAASNGGKTWTSLELAFGIVEELTDRGVLQGSLEGKVGMVDTERRSGQLYAHLGPFDTIELGPPYTVERYVGAMTALERAGCAVIILDSISHAWQGAGGVLSLLDRFEAKERFSAFGSTVNPQQDEFVDAMLRSPAHVIATMRSKTAWVLEDKQTRGGHTVKAPRRIGMAPIQRPGIEYEFTTMLDLETNSHAATVVKNRCPVFQDWQPKRISREHGRALARWLLEGAPEPELAPAGTPLERAQAASDAGVRACERAGNQPDLARVFEGAIEALRAFSGVVEKDELLALRQRVIDAKDQMKVFLGRRREGAELTEPVLDPDDAIALESLAALAQVAPSALCAALGVGRLSLIPAARLGEACQWVYDHAGEDAEVVLPPRFVAAGVVVEERRRPAAKPAASKPGSFADMADDLPW